MLVPHDSGLIKEVKKKETRGGKVTMLKVGRILKLCWPRHAALSHPWYLKNPRCTVIGYWYTIWQTSCFPLVAYSHSKFSFYLLSIIFRYNHWRKIYSSFFYLWCLVFELFNFNIIYFVLSLQKYIFTDWITKIEYFNIRWYPGVDNITSDKRRSSKVLNCKTASVKFSLVAAEKYFVSNETIKEKFNEFCFRILNTTWNRWLYWLMSGSMRSLHRKSEGGQGENFSRVSHCQMSPIHSIQRYTCVVFSLPHVISSISMIFPVWTYKYMSGLH